MSETKTFNRLWVVVGAILIQLCLGAIYAWSVFTPALTEAGWTKAQTQIVFATGLAFFAIVMLLAGRLLVTVGPRALAIWGGIVLGFGYFLAGLFGGTNFVAILIYIGVIGGSGIGLAYLIPITVGMRWFPDKKGLIAGLAVAGFGFGAMFWVKIADTWGALLMRFGLSSTFMIYGVVFMVLVVIGGIWMVFPPEGWSPPGWHPEQAAKKKRSLASAANFNTGEMLSSPQFYMIFMTFVFGASAGLMSIGLMKLFPMTALMERGVDVMSATVISGTAMAIFFSLANGLGRILWGAISDRIGSKLAIIIMMASQGVCVILFQWMAGTPVLLYLGATLIGFNFGGNFSLFPAVTSEVFGSKFMGPNYPFVFLAYGVGGIMGPIMGGWLGDMQNFPLAFTICGVLCLVSAFIIGNVRAVSDAV